MESVTKAQIRGISDIDDDEELPPQNLNQPKNHNSDQYSFQSEFFKGKGMYINDTETQKKHPR